MTIFQHVIRYLRPFFTYRFGLFFICLCWLVFWRSIYFHPGFYLPRDNSAYHLEIYNYIVHYLLEFRSIPTWVFTRNGGIWLEPLSNNLLIIAPHRIIGYLLTWFFPMSTNLTYKISFLVLGLGFFLVPFYFLLKKILNHGVMALCGVVIFLVTFGGPGILHQEQALGTMLYLPLIWLCLLRAKENIAYLIPMASLIGLSLNTHYPHLMFIYLCSLILGAIFEGPHHFVKSLIRFFRSSKNIKTSFIALFCFLVSLSPLIFSVVNYSNLLKSPFRGQSGIFAATFKDYVELCKIQDSNIHPINYAKYFGGKCSSRYCLSYGDENLFFITPLLLLALISIIFYVRIPMKRFQLLIIFLLGLSAMGIYGPLIRVWWSIFPPISMFRQWYHLIPLFNLHLLVLSLYFLRWYLLSGPLPYRWLPLSINVIILGFLSIMGYSSTNIGITTLVFLIMKHFSKCAQFGRVALIIWFVGGSIQWGWRKMEIILGGRAFEFKTLGEEIWKFHPEIKNQISHRDHSGYFGNQVLVVPKEVDEKSVRKFYEDHGLISWFREPSSLIPLKPHEFNISFQNGKILFQQFSMEKSGKKWVISQFNDGGWLLEDSNGTLIPIQSGVHGLISFHLGEGEKTFSLRRKASIWPWLVLLHFLPTLCSFFCLNRMRGLFPVRG